MPFQQDRLFMCMIWALRRWRPRHGPTCLPAPLLFAGWSTTTVSMETTSPDSTPYPERWMGPIQKMPGITSWTVPTLVSSSSSLCHICFMLELNKFLGFCVWPAGHGAGYQPPKCSDVKLDAITTDDAGKMYAFAGNRVLICIKCQSFWHCIQAFHSCLLQAFSSHHLHRTHLHAPGHSARRSPCLPHHSFVEGGGWKGGCSIFLQWQNIPNQGTFSYLFWH